MASEDISLASSTSRIFPNPDTSTFKATTYHDNFTSRLVSYRERERFTDVILKSGHLELPCHRVVLAAASSHFNKMFDREMKDEKSAVVELKTFSPDILATVVDFIYTAMVTLNTNNVQSLCSACDELGLDELKSGCDEFMAARVEPYNCLGLYVFSKLHDLKLTFLKSKDCMLKRLKDIMRLSLDQEFKGFDENSMIEYISNDDLEVENEAEIFQFVEKWVDVDATARQNSVDRIMEYVRLPFCSPEYLHNEIEESPIIQSKRCLSLLLEAHKHHNLPRDRQKNSGVRTKPRNIWMTMLLFDGNNSSGGKCWQWEKQKQGWEEFTTLPVQKLKYFKACVSGTDIIVTGGHVDGTSINSSWAFSVKDKHWQELPSMIDCRCHHAVVSVSGEVYALGGWGSNDSRINMVERLDAKRQGWKQLATMKHRLEYHLAINIDGSIFVIGGRNQSGNASQITQVYDIGTDQWQLKANMPQPCERGSAVYLNDKIYVVGGEEQCCMSYNCRQDTWTTHAQPVHARIAPAAVAWRGKILLCGGSMRNDVEEYEAEKGKWTAWSEPLPSGFRWHSIVTVNTRIC